MRRVGVVGLGDMGLPMAGNLVKAGFPITGYDVRAEQRAALETVGGKPAQNAREVGTAADSVFVMVMTGDQLADVVLGKDGLADGLESGGTVICSATVGRAAVRALEQPLAERHIGLIDTPVSGGQPGAVAGQLTLMAAAKADVLEANRPVLDAVAGRIFHVGEEIGQGQTTKAALQALNGSVFAATFEALVLGSKAGIKGQTLYDVFMAAGVGCPMIENCARLIMDRRFEGSGSHIGTMHKDLGISLGLARELGAAMFTTAAASQLFQAGISLYPDGDNWTIVRLLERIADTEVTW